MLWFLKRITLGCFVMALVGCDRFVDPECSPLAERKQNKNLQDNMRLVENSANRYFEAHNRRYPSSADDLKPFFQFGDPAQNKPGDPPANPYTNKQEFPTTGNVINAKDSTKKEITGLKPGEIQYNSTNGGTGYAIIGGDKDGKAFSGREQLEIYWLDENLHPPAEYGKQLLEKEDPTVVLHK
jgi:hypothetical protein